MRERIERGSWRSGYLGDLLNFIDDNLAEISCLRIGGMQRERKGGSFIKLGGSGEHTEGNESREI